MSKPFFSVVTTCYNDAKFLGEACRSVLEQTHSDWEHIIVDDGSTDHSFDVAKSYFNIGYPRVRIVRNDTNRGHATAMNAGVRASKGEWIVKLDADDRFRPTYLQRLFEAIANDHTLNVVFSPALMFGLGRPVSYRYPEFDPSRMVDEFMLPGPAATHRSLWIATGGVDESLTAGEDWDFYVRAQITVGLHVQQLAQPLWEYRQHAIPRMHDHGLATIDSLKAHMRGHFTQEVSS